jgi:hypothetical protein
VQPGHRYRLSGNVVDFQDQIPFRDAGPFGKRVQCDLMHNRLAAGSFQCKSGDIPPILLPEPTSRSEVSLMVGQLEI